MKVHLHNTKNAGHGIAWSALAEFPGSLLAAAKKVTSGDIPGMLKSIPPEIREQVRSAAQRAYSSGFGLAALLAAAVSLAACLLTWYYVRAEDTAPGTNKNNTAERHEPHCKLVDCRHPI